MSRKNSCFLMGKVPCGFEGLDDTEREFWKAELGFVAYQTLKLIIAVWQLLAGHCSAGNTLLSLII